MPKGAVLFNLSAYRSGAGAVVDSISSGQRGIYAWFRNFKIRSEDKEFTQDLLEALAAPKFQTRTGTVGPFYEVNVESKTGVSEGKRDALLAALQRPDFVSSVRHALEWGVLFQAPLYIGKSIDLRTRIGQHLKADSQLRLRLDSVSINLDDCFLLILPIASDDDSKEIEDNPSETDSDELLIEEIFSRLFNPGFTLRIG